MAGGGTYCAVASLHVMGFIEHDVQSQKCSIVYQWHSFVWCLQRQVAEGGFQGRANKPSDAMHFGMCKNTSQKIASQEAFYLCFDKGSMLVQGWGSFEVLRRIQVDCLLRKLCADFFSPVNLTY
ncbi:hypothetical protein NC652_026496 [Populus alba x Populus x berolinensis]|nr:hypothetical protein NC652_026496 [Populus alba x Populus x berolinensis]